jgi:hypothetical protein
MFLFGNTDHMYMRTSSLFSTMVISRSVEGSLHPFLREPHLIFTLHPTPQALEHGQACQVDPLNFSIEENLVP